MRKIAHTETTMRHQGERFGASDSGCRLIRSAKLSDGAISAGGGMGWMEQLMRKKRKSNEESNSRSMQIQLEESA